MALFRKGGKNNNGRWRERQGKEEELERRKNEYLGVSERQNREK